MGRGRAKAKQTKVARDLKYQTLETDFTRLQRELHGEPPVSAVADDDALEDDGYEDDGYDGRRSSAV